MGKYGYEGSETFRPLSPWNYFGLTILYAIPIVGFIFLLIHTFSDQNINRRSFARSFWCTLLIASIVSILLLILGLIVGLPALSTITFEIH